jgi:hypothetical protein
MPILFDKEKQVPDVWTDEDANHFASHVFDLRREGCVAGILMAFHLENAITPDEIRAAIAANPELAIQAWRSYYKPLW